MTFLLHQVLIHSAINVAILDSAFSKSVHLLTFLKYWTLMNERFCVIYYQKLNEDHKLLYVHGLCIHNCDPLQFHGKFSGFSKIASTFVLYTKVLKLDILIRIGLVSL